MSSLRPVALLLALCLLLALFGCQKSGKGDEKQPNASTNVSLSLPADVYYISISLIAPDGGGYAPIPREQIGVIRQLTDEANACVLTPLPTITDLSFDNGHYFEIRFYTETTSKSVSVDQNGLIAVGDRTYTLHAGTLTYAHIAGYYEAFRVEE